MGRKDSKSSSFVCLGISIRHPTRHFVKHLRHLKNTKGVTKLSGLLAKQASVPFLKLSGLSVLSVEKNGVGCNYLLTDVTKGVQEGLYPAPFHGTRYR